ncbi:MAG: DUF6249 domain-containing protein [Burkholderiaceae bacterium]|jgi:hypothetical protein|nr:DUF6249 domain-containing protein [Burkholderiaceae bacterium]
MSDFLTESPVLTAMLTVGVPLAGMALAGFIVYIELHFKHKRAERVLQTLQHLADRGMPAPASLLDLVDDSLFESGRRNRRSPWANAINTVGAGVGLVVMFWLLGLKFLTGIGALVICVGLAQLLAQWVETRQARRDPAATAAR